MRTKPQIMNPRCNNAKDIINHANIVGMDIANDLHLTAMCTQNNNCATAVPIRISVSAYQHRVISKLSNAAAANEMSKPITHLIPFPLESLMP